MSDAPRRVIGFTVVTHDMAASVRFWRDGIGYKLLERNLLGDPLPMTGREYALLQLDGASHGFVRLLQAEPGTGENRPRPGTHAWDPGLAVLEMGTTDPEESFRRVTAAGGSTISPPRPYFFRNAGALWNRDVVSYAAFGPAGEEMFITKGVTLDDAGNVIPRPWLYGDAIHGPVGNAVIPNLNRKPVLEFYERVFGLRPSVDAPCLQETVNEIIGAPKDTFFQMIMLGWDDSSTVGIEVEEYQVPAGREHPTDLNRTGLAMFTLRVADLEATQRRAADAGARITGRGAFPIHGNERPDGFIVRGAVGELIEVIGG